MVSRALLSSDSSEWGTPPDFAAALDAQFGFQLDVCATKATAKAPVYFDAEADGLRQRWAGKVCWMNPPYGRGPSGISPWMRRARLEAMFGGATVVQLPPARVGSEWWRRFVMNSEGEVGRLLRSNFFPEEQILSLRWEGLFTQVHHVAGRLGFVGAADDGAPFDSAVVVHYPATATRPKHDPVKLERARASGPFAKLVPLFERAWL